MAVFSMVLKFRQELLPGILPKDVKNTWFEKPCGKLCTLGSLKQKCSCAFFETGIIHTEKVSLKNWNFNPLKNIVVMNGNNPKQT